MSTVFPKWTNRLPTILAVGGTGALVTVIGLVWYYFTPKFWRVGYMPTQPGGGFNHEIHAGKLGLDCRYCHSHVEESPEANIPTASTCIGCHAEGHVDDVLYAKVEKVKFIRDAWESDQSIQWRRIHKVPDYVRNFPHNVHLKAGVSCFSCHGNIMEQTVVHQVQPLSMGFCLDCHRNPTPNLVPPDKVTDLYWVRRQFEITEGANTKVEKKDAPEGTLDVGSPGGEELLKGLEQKQLHLLPTNCGACHF